MFAIAGAYASEKARSHSRANAHGHGGYFRPIYNAGYFQFSATCICVFCAPFGIWAYFYQCGLQKTKQQYQYQVFSPIPSPYFQKPKQTPKY
jgi:hypothetical protein